MTSELFPREGKSSLVRGFYLKKKKLYLLTLPKNYEIITNEDAKNANKKRLFVKIISPTSGKPDFILLSVYEE